MVLESVYDDQIGELPMVFLRAIIRVWSGLYEALGFSDCISVAITFSALN